MRLEPKYLQALRKAAEEQHVFFDKVLDSKNPAIICGTLAMETGDAQPLFENCYFSRRHLTRWVDAGDSSGQKHVVAQVLKAKMKIVERIRDSI